MRWARLAPFPDGGIAHGHKGALRGYIGAASGHKRAVYGYIGVMYGRRDAVRGYIGVMYGRKDAVHGYIRVMYGRKDAVRGYIGAMYGRKDAVRGYIGLMYGRRDAVHGYMGVARGRKWVSGGRSVLRRFSERLPPSESTVPRHLSRSLRRQSHVNLTRTNTKGCQQQERPGFPGPFSLDCNDRSKRYAASACALRGPSNSALRIFAITRSISSSPIAK
jgi:hypothetical protein